MQTDPDMVPASAHHVANFNEFDGHWTMSPQRHLYTLSSCSEWTIATWYLSAHPSL